MVLYVTYLVSYVLAAALLSSGKVLQHHDYHPLHHVCCTDQ